MLKKLTFLLCIGLSVHAHAGYKLVKPVGTLKVLETENGSILSSILLNNGTVGLNYNQSVASALTVTNPKVTSRIWSGVGFPEGMSISMDGIVSGVPTEAGEFNLVISANTGYESLFTRPKLVIAPQLSLLGASATFTLGQPITLNAASNLTVVGMANSPAIEWTWQNLPPFLTASGSTLSGSTTEPGTYTLTANASLLGATANAQYQITVSKAGLTNYGAYRAWSDGTYASSCKKYYDGDSSHSYSGSTGDGIYRLSVNGEVSDTYCDMTNGGWTLVLNGKSDSGAGFTGYPTATGNFGPAVTPITLQNATWKFSDAKINALKTYAYRVVGTGSYNATRYFKAACTYQHSTLVSGDCATSYPNDAFNTGARVGREGKGLSDNTGAGAYLVMVNNHTGYEGFGWCVGTGSGGSGGCGNAGSRTDIKVWVK